MWIEYENMTIVEDYYVDFQHNLTPLILLLMAVVT